MNLEQVFIENHGKKKILDSCAFSPDKKLSRTIYDCKDPKDLPFDRIADCSKHLDTFSLPKMEAVGVYVIPECIQENSRLLEHLKSKLDFLEARYGMTKELEPLVDLFRHFGSLITDLRSSRDLTSKFSKEQEVMYKKFTGEIIPLSLKDSLKIDFSYRYNDAPHQKCEKEENNTDEKIIAAALVLAEEKPVIVMTRDSDILRIAYSSLREVYRPIRQVKVFADFGEGFELFVDSYDLRKTGNNLFKKNIS